MAVNPNSRFVNLPLLANPLNWLTLFVWVFILGYLVHTFDPHLRQSYGKGNNQ